MAIDPRIALGVQPAQIQSPLENAANVMQLQAFQQRNALAQRQFEAEQAAAAREADRQMRLNALLEVRQGSNMLDPTNAARMLALGGGEELKALTNAQAANLAREKQAVELPIAQWSQFRDELAALDPANQAGYQAWAARVVSAAPWAARLLPPTIDANSQRRLLMTAESALPKGEVRDIGGGTATINPYTGEQIGGTIMNVPEPADVFQQGLAKASASAPKTSINLPSKKFQETLGEKAALRLDTYRENAEVASRSIDTNARLRPLINDPKFISGTFADARLAVAKAVGIDVSATESFLAGMAEQVAARIRAFGTGTGLSNEDRKYAEKWAGGSPDLSAPGIARIMRINDATSDAAITTYNRERNFLAEKEPAVVDYYPEIGARGVKPGDIKKGYRFKGGDPANQANWEKVGQ